MVSFFSKSYFFEKREFGLMITPNLFLSATTGSAIIPGLYAASQIQSFEGLFTIKNNNSKNSQKSKIICPPESPVILFINEIKKHPRLLNSISFWDFLSAKDKEWTELEEYLKKCVQSKSGNLFIGIFHFFKLF